MKSVFATAFVLAGVMATSAASAGDRALVSALPILPAPKNPTYLPTMPEGKKSTVPGMTTKVISNPHHQWIEATAAKTQGYCFASKEFGLRLQTETSGPATGGLTDDLWRITEADGKATLERTTFEVATVDASAWTKSRVSISLSVVSKMNGVTVWGFRESNGDIVLLARGGDSGRESQGLRPDDEGAGSPFLFTSSDCSFGAVRLSHTLMKSGATAQLRGNLPPVGEGKNKTIPRFVVDLSLAQLSRDPEPTLSVRVRVVD